VGLNPRRGRGGESGYFQRKGPSSRKQETVGRARTNERKVGYACSKRIRWSYENSGPDRLGTAKRGIGGNDMPKRRKRAELPQLEKVRARRPFKARWREDREKEKEAVFCPVRGEGSSLSTTTREILLFLWKNLQSKKDRRKKRGREPCRANVLSCGSSGGR